MTPSLYWTSPCLQDWLAWWAKSLANDETSDRLDKALPLLSCCLHVDIGGTACRTFTPCWTKETKGETNTVCVSIRPPEHPSVLNSSDVTCTSRPTTLCYYYCSGDSGIGVKYSSERTTEEEHIVHTEQPSLVFLLRGWALLSVGELELDTAYISLPHPWWLLTLLSAFLALSSLLIYRIMHQTSSRGDTVTQAAAPSAFTLILTTEFDQLESPRHFSLLSYKHTKVDKYPPSILTA